MRMKHWLIFLPLLAALGGKPPSAWAQEGGDFVPGRVLVKFKDTASGINQRRVLSRLRGRVERVIAGVNVQVVDLPPNASPLAMARNYASDPNVEFAEPDYIMHAFGHGNSRLSPNDPLFPQQWALDNTGQTGGKIGADIEAPEAWAHVDADQNSALPAVFVAVLDTGIDENHPDLQGKIVKQRNFTISPTPHDLYGHGTHVAGTVAAQTNNSAGVAGVGYSASLMNVKVLGDDGSGPLSGIIDGLLWAVDNGANVVSMSFGSTFNSFSLENAVNQAWQKGAVLVAAAGNFGSTQRSYPAAYANVIAVAATDNTDRRAGFSSYGAWVSIGAPGVNVLSTTPTGPSTIWPNPLNPPYGTLSGTSMACPHVSGVAALVWASQSNLTNAQVRSQIENGADNIGVSGIGRGRLNAHNAVTFQAEPPPPQPSTLQVAVSTDRSVYWFWFGYAWGIISVRVADNANTPVAGASVHVEVETPNGGRFGSDSTTDGNGLSQFLFIVYRFDGRGTYKVTATARKGEASGTGTTTFEVR